MKNKPWTIVGAGIVIAAIFCAAPVHNQKRALKDDRDRASYAFGVNVGKGLKQRQADFDARMIRRGLMDAMAGRALLVSPSEMSALLKTRGREPSAPRQKPKKQAWGAIFDLFSPFKGEREKASYAFGANMGTGWKAAHLDLVPDTVILGLKDLLAGGALLMSPEAADETLGEYGRAMTARQQETRWQLAEKNKREGEAFLARNGKKPNVVTLPCGVQYKVLASGSGNSPELQNYVEVRYRGTLIDGTEFANCSDKNGTCILGLSGIVRGLSDVLQLMKPGAKWRVFIPSDEGCGSEGGPRIPPNAALVYDLELVSILPDRPVFKVDNSE